MGTSKDLKAHECALLPIEPSSGAGGGGIESWGEALAAAAIPLLMSKGGAHFHVPRCDWLRALYGANLEVSRPDFNDFRQPDLAESHQATQENNSRPFSADGVAGTDAPPDHRAVLLRAATMAWFEAMDDHLRPMIPQEKEALAAWMMGASFCILRLDLWSARTRGLQGS